MQTDEHWLPATRARLDRSHAWSQVVVGTGSPLMSRRHVAPTGSINVSREAWS